MTLGSLVFRCNICGSPSIVTFNRIPRDRPSCDACASSMRMRAVVNALSQELFAQSLVIDDFPERRDYLNTFYHQEPYLDIMAPPPPELRGAFDFVICSEVLEHVPPSVSTAFDNLRLLLKPDGVLIFSSPYRRGGDITLEHFPDLHEYEILDSEKEQVLRNVTRDGEVQVFEDLKFHGGDGATLEMRVFTRSSLIEEFLRAGFAEPRFHYESVFEFGIRWGDRASLPMGARIALPGPSD
jgi:SAM-dependent methyltransferase